MITSDKEREHYVTLVRENLRSHLWDLTEEAWNILTEEQKDSAARVIQWQGYHNGTKKSSYWDGALLIKFPHILIGIEKDGYAHS